MIREVNEKAKFTIAIIARSILIFLVLLSFLQVLMRYLFNSPFTFAEELLRILLVYLAMFGMVYAIGSRQHMRLVFFKDSLRGVGRYIVVLSIDIIVVLFLIIVFIIGGTRFVIDNYGSVTAAMQLNKGYVYSIIPISGILAALMQVLCLIDELQQEQVQNG